MDVVVVLLTSVYSKMIVVIRKSWSVRHRGATVPVILREIIHHIEAYRDVHGQINRKLNPEVDKTRNHWGESPIFPFFYLNSVETVDCF